MRVSFITTVLNEKETIGAFLESLAGQTRPPDEVWIVDGGSTDGTVAALEEFRDRFASFDVIVRKCNIAAGRNEGAKRSTGDVLAFSDAGCYLQPSWLQNLVAPFERDAATDLCAGNWAIREERGAREIFRWFYLRYRTRGGPDSARNPSTRSMAIRKDAWMRLGGQPEFLQAGEDTLFNIKARLHGLKFAFADKAVCEWRMHATYGGFGRQVRGYARASGRLARRNALWGYWRYRRNFVAAWSTAVLSLGLLCASPALGLLPAAGVAALLLLELAYWKFDEFRRARRHGFGLARSIHCCLVGLLADWNSFRGMSLGLRERARGEFETQTLEYVSALHAPEAKRSRAATTASDERGRRA